MKTLSTAVASISNALSIGDLRRIAKRRLPKSIFEFVDGGAEDELTLHDNRAAFERIRFRPRILSDVRSPGIATNLFGSTVSAPIVIAPMGSCMLVWPEADIAIARAAAAHGIPYTLSTMSTTSIERMAEAVQGPLWFQLYVLKDHTFNERLLERAQAAGYQTLVVTVDLQAGGKRERDLRNGVSIPLRIRPRHLLEGVMHPGWAWQMLRSGLPEFENVRGYLGENRAGLTIAARVGQSLDAGFSWDGFRRLRDKWSGTLVIKGVAHPEDALRLAEYGADGLWISNHGGRQLDGAIASADALREIASVTKGKIPLMIDSGVRRGSDILKACATGASAVAIGRSVLFGAAAGGEQGARRAIEILIDELKLAMKLSGTPSLASVNSDLITL